MILPDQLGEWLRRPGIHEEHLKLWRTEIRETLKVRHPDARKRLADKQNKVRLPDPEER